MECWIKPAKWADLTKAQKRLNVFWTVTTLVYTSLQAYQQYKNAQTIMLLEEENLALSLRNGELAAAHWKTLIDEGDRDDVR